MMLVRSSLHSSIDGGPSSVYDHGSWHEHTVCDEHHQQSHQNAAPITEHKNKVDGLCSRNLLSSSQLSTEVNMSDSSTPNFVYKRKMIQRNADVLPLNRTSTCTLVYKRRKVQTVFPAQVSTNIRESDNCFSADSSAAISISDKEQVVSLLHIDKGTLGKERIIEGPKSEMQKYMGLRAVNDSCSSSKSNVDLGSAFLKHQMDDVGECSSSGILIVEGLERIISETNSCVSFLRCHGVLDAILSTNRSSKKPVDVENNISCMRSCKVCDRSTTTLKMLICDLCEDSFHMSCCNPIIKKVPVGDWFCHSCSGKKLKKLKEINSSKLTKNYSGPIASMLRDADVYTSDVRIGKDFQAEVPDWSVPLTEKPTEINPLECAGYQDWDSSKLLRLSSIGNWLQCRAVLDGVDGSVCGKWRRAPLFEVQTDGWECFCSVLWDPTHADCAVPQELDTDQVLKQLKYIEMLRPRLSAKKWKLRVSKGVDEQRHIGDPRNTQKS